MKTPTPTGLERRIAKALVASGETAQDVHLFINIGRKPSINFGRITGSKDWKIEPASELEIARFRYEKSLIDLKTGLSPFEDERLVRAREAMLLAVQTFNMPLILFKVELFSVLSCVAWTYVLHEFYLRKGIPIEDDQGNSLLISQILKRPDCPLGIDARKNLIALKEIRDKVEHKVLNSLGVSFFPLFQATCLNFEEFICARFGKKLSLGSELSYAIQFSKLSLEQISAIQKYDITPQIEAINISIETEASIDGTEGADYKLKVHFSFEKVAKGDANTVFTNNNPLSSTTQTVVIQKVASDENWPYKPNDVVKLVKATGSSPFTSHQHTQALRKFAVRPLWKSSNPEVTNKTYCAYHQAHKDYTYSLAWVEKLIAVITDEVAYSSLKEFKL